MKINKTNIELLSITGAGILAVILLSYKLISSYNEETTRLISESGIKETEVLKYETEIEYIKIGDKTKRIVKKYVTLDTNNNGYEDTNDVIVDSNMFDYFLPEKGNNVLYIQNSRDLIPLALQNSNGYYNLINKPSEFYGKKAGELDEQLYDIINKQNKLR